MKNISQNRKGFSLLETIILIAVILVLMMLVSQSVSVVRSTATRLKCASNLRQIGIGLIQYESLHGKFPDFGNALLTGWAYSILPYVESQQMDSSIDLGNSAPPLSPPIFQCPTNKALGIDINPAIQVHFGINPKIADRPSGVILQKHNVILAGELPTGIGVPWYSSPGLVEADLGFHHNDLTNAVFCDGHTGSISLHVIDQIKKASFEIY